MLHIQEFIEDNRVILREVCNLELVHIQRISSNHSLHLAARFKYMDLLRKFEDSFPRICTSFRLLYWGFIRARISRCFLEAGDPTEAYNMLQTIFSEAANFDTVHKLIDKLRHPENFANGGRLDNSELILLNSFAGLLQTLFNLLAASVTPETKEPVLTSRDAGASLHWLQCSKRVHDLFVEHNDAFVGPMFWETIAFKQLLLNIEGISGVQEDSTRQRTPERLLFEHGYTSTIFLLAQAYQLAGEPKQAASCCQLTLARQLEFSQPFKELTDFALPREYCSRRRISSARRSKEASPSVYGDMHRRFTAYISPAIHAFNPLEWAKNAADLSEYYLTVEEPNGYFHSTLECLLSACSVLDQSKSQVTMIKSKKNQARRSSTTLLNKYHKVKADVYRRLGEFGLMVLEKGEACVRENLQLLQMKWNQTASESAKEFGCMFQLNLGPMLLNVTQSRTTITPSVPSTPPCSGTVPPSSSPTEQIVDMLATCPTNFESANLVFRMIDHSLTEAERYYSINEHFSDAVALSQARSKSYRLLATYDPTEVHQCCMHKRRIDILEKCLAPMNRKLYLSLYRQLMFELAEALTALRDLKHRAYNKHRNVDAAMSVHYARKSNALAKRALTGYQQILTTFTGSSQQIGTLSLEEIRPVLTAHLSSARLFSSLITTTPEERVRNTTKSFNHYNYVVCIVDHHLRTHPNSPIADDDEVQIARDMVQLLPVKLTKLARGEQLPD